MHEVAINPLQVALVDVDVSASTEGIVLSFAFPDLLDPGGDSGGDAVVVCISSCERDVSLTAPSNDSLVTSS